MVYTTWSSHDKTTPIACTWKQSTGVGMHYLSSSTKYKLNASSSIWHIMFTKQHMLISPIWIQEAKTEVIFDHIYPFMISAARRKQTEVLFGSLEPKRFHLILYSHSSRSKGVLHQPYRENQQISSANTISKMNFTVQKKYKPGKVSI